MILLVVFAVWFAAAIPVAFIVGRMFAKREAARRDRYIPPPPRPHHRGETHDRLR